MSCQDEAASMFLHTNVDVNYSWNNEGEKTETKRFLEPNSARCIHILVLVLVEIVVEIVKRMVTLMPVQVNGV